MKVTFVCPKPNLTGGFRVVAAHADQLLDRGHDVMVVARRHGVPTLGTRLRRLARGQRPPAPPATTHFDRMRAPLVVVPHHGPITADDVPDADAIVATWWETAFEIVHFPAAKGRKHYFVQHHEVHSHLPSHISGGSYFLPIRKITITSWLSDAMRDLYGDGDAALVPNSVDHDLFFAPERGKQAVPTVGLLYFPTPFKGVDVAFRAIEIARRAHPRLRVVVFGMRPPIKRLPLPDGAEFILAPPQDRLREIYASCDAFITASRSEGFGLPILEAMACRTPVVATRTGCAEDVIENGVNGYLADIGDAEALGARLSEILSSDESRWRAMSQAAHRKTLAYTWSDAGALFEAALRG